MRLTIKRCLAVTALATLVASAMALPAAAAPEDQQSVVFVGTAQTGTTADAEGNPEGQGLYLPDPTGIVYQNQPTGTWKFTGPTCAATVDGLGCYIDAAGKLRPIPGTPIGITCISSQAHDGEGIFRTAGMDATSERYRVSDIGWPAAFTGTLVVSGDYEYQTLQTVNNVPTWVTDSARTGEFTGLVQVSGGQNCAIPGSGGATDFEVVGVVSIL